MSGPDRSKRPLALGMAAVLAGAAFLLGLKAFWIDPQDFLWRLNQEVGPARANAREMAQRFHLSEGPCLRYVDPLQIDPEALASAAKAFVDAGLGARSRDLYPLLWYWSRDEADRLHGRSEERELLELGAERMGAFDGLLLSLHRGRLERVLKDSAQDTRERMTGKATRLYEGLPRRQQTALREIWKAHPRLFILPMMSRMTEALREARTEARLDDLVLAVQRWAQRQRRMPEDLKAVMDIGLPARELYDDWGGRIVYTLKADHAEIVAPGARGHVEESELRRRIEIPEMPPEATPGPTPAPAAPTGCLALKSKIWVPALRLQAALVNPQDPTRKQRFDPVPGSGKDICGGARLQAVQPSSLFERIRLCEGDILVRFGGEPVCGPAALDVGFAKLQRAPVELQVQRGEQRYVVELVKLPEPSTP